MAYMNHLAVFKSTFGCFSRSQSLRTIAIFVLLHITVTNAANNCPCGYEIFATSDVVHQLYTEVLETDFLHLQSLKSNPCWIPQQYNVTAAAGRGKYGKEATLANVVPNPYAAVATSSGPTLHGGDAGLQLWVGSTLVDGLVPMGEIASKRADMAYGSFRIGMKVTSVSGTCGAFFWYRNDSQEIDMEILSSSFNATSQPIYLVMQTPESASAGYNAAGTQTFTIAPLPFNPELDFHEYRFDWTPDGVRYFADGQVLSHMDYSYPHLPGHLSINHWSNGNFLWSQGPPQSPALLTISYVKAYFNSTNPATPNANTLQCSDAASKCVVPEDATHFFNATSCGEGASPSSGTSAAQPSTTSGKSGAERRGRNIDRLAQFSVVMVILFILWNSV